MSSIVYCEACGKEILEDWRSLGKARKRPLRFCSRACANKRRSTSESKAKASEKVKEAIQKHFENGCKCEKCGNIFHSKDLSRKLCFECLPTTIKHTSGKPKSSLKTIKSVSKRTASKILKRMDLPCSCCGFYIKGVILDIHHIIPKHNGGLDDMSNLTYICPNCHRIAHTDISLLKKPLVSIEQQLIDLGKNWKDFYYG